MRSTAAAVALAAVAFGCSAPAEPQAASPTTPPTVAPPTVASTVVPSTTVAEPWTVPAESTTTSTAPVTDVSPEPDPPTERLAPGSFDLELPAPQLTGPGALTPVETEVEIVFDWGVPCTVPVAIAETTYLLTDAGWSDFTALDESIVELDRTAEGLVYERTITSLTTLLRGEVTGTSSSPSFIQDLNMRVPVLVLGEIGEPLDARLRDGLDTSSNGYEFALSNVDNLASAELSRTLDTWVGVWRRRGSAGPEIAADRVRQGSRDVVVGWRALGRYDDGTVHLLLAEQADGVPIVELYPGAAEADQDVTVSYLFQVEAIVDPATFRPMATLSSSTLRFSSAPNDRSADEQITTTFDWANAVGCV